MGRRAMTRPEGAVRGREGSRAASSSLTATCWASRERDAALLLLPLAVAVPVLLLAPPLKLQRMLRLIPAITLTMLRSLMAVAVPPVLLIASAAGGEEGGVAGDREGGAPGNSCKGARTRKEEGGDAPVWLERCRVYWSWCIRPGQRPVSDGEVTEVCTAPTWRASDSNRRAVVRPRRHRDLRHLKSFEAPLLRSPLDMNAIHPWYRRQAQRPAHTRPPPPVMHPLHRWTAAFPCQSRSQARVVAVQAAHLQQ